MVIGAGFAAALSAGAKPAMSECASFAVSQFQPVAPVVWIGPTLYWIGARGCKGEVAYGLIARQPGRAPRLVWDLAHPGYCHDTGTGQLHVLAKSDGDVRLATVSGAGESLTRTGDPSAFLTGCRKYKAETVQRFHAETGARAIAIAIGPRASMICLRGEDRTSRLAWLTDGRAQPLATITAPLAGHNPSLDYQTHGGGFLAYPNLSFDQRRALSARLPGIPVQVISARGDVTQIDVPWGGWNAEGAYQIAMTARGLAMAVSPVRGNRGQSPGGIHTQATDWARQGGPGIDSDSLAVRADGSALAWRARPAGPENAFYAIHFLSL